MNAAETMPSLAGLIKDGYCNEIVRALLDALTAYGDKLAGDNCCTAADSENIYFLVALVRSILQDCHGIRL